ARWAHYDRLGPAVRPGSIPPLVAAAAAAVAAATTAVAAATARGAGPRLVDRQATALVVVAVEVLDRGVGVGGVLHLAEPEAAAPPGLTVAQHLGRPDRAVLLEQLLKVLRGHRVAEVPDVKPFCHRTRALTGSPPPPR